MELVRAAARMIRREGKDRTEDFLLLEVPEGQRKYLIGRGRKSVQILIPPEVIEQTRNKCEFDASLAVSMPAQKIMVTVFLIEEEDSVYDIVGTHGA